MTFAEALVVLGIDSRTDSRSGRRAYLRMVKAFKPERDPEGFRRVRTAWELVEPHLPTPRRTDQPPHPRRVDAEPVPAALFTPPPLEVPDPTDAPPPPPAEPLPALDGWTPPPSPDPSLFLAEAVANAATDAGYALSCLTRALNLASTGALPEPDLRVVLDVVLGLHRSGAVQEARQAWTAVRDWTDATGAGTRLSATLVGWLALVQELSELPDRFPPAARRHMAEAIADQDPAIANNGLLELSRTAPHLALEAAELLEVHAPNLRILYSGSLRERVATSPPKPEPDASFGPWLRGLLLFCGLFLIVAIGLRVCGSQAPRAVYSPPAGIPAWELPRPEPNVFPPLELHTAQSDPLALILLCSSLHPAEVCRAAREAYATMKDEDCPSARDALARARAEAERHSVRGEDTFMDSRWPLGEITRSIDARCPPRAHRRPKGRGPEER